ncbi:MAG: response regulator [Elusimicrobia bacterium]|nr:response regulator [Elusimicrobiota bacterium]
MKVLVADDDAVLRRLIARIIEREGGSVSMAEDGVDLWKKWEATRCEVILSDIDMPGQMDGVAACAEIQRRSPAALIFMMTGDPESADRAERAGLRVAFRKPFLEEDVKNWLAALSRKKRAGGVIAGSRRSGGWRRPARRGGRSVSC